MINPIDCDALRVRVQSAEPFPHCLIDNFLDPDFAVQAHDAFPSYREGVRIGQSFRTVNERSKVQITDVHQFAPAIGRLSALLASDKWLADLAFVFGKRNLIADEQLVGGGIHEMARGGRLDVHVDFNYMAERQLHRRLNLLIFFNRNWKPEWDGHLELWDRDVRVCRQSFAPIFNRCVVFETSDISFHGVSTVQCPLDHARKSFAAYYYSREAPTDWTGTTHSTVFRPRPDEFVKGRVLMPAEHAARASRRIWWRLRSGVKKILIGG